MPARRAARQTPARKRGFSSSPPAQLTGTGCRRRSSRESLTSRSARASWLRATMRWASREPPRARRSTPGASAAIRATGSGEPRMRRARAKPVAPMVARSHSRPIQKAEPSSPRSGPQPPARAHRPRASRPRAMDPVPASRRTPARSPSAPRWAASASEMTRTRCASARSRRAWPLRSAAVHTPFDATTSHRTSSRCSVQRRQRRRRRAGSPPSPREGPLNSRRRSRASRAITRTQVPPRSTPIHHCCRRRGLMDRLEGWVGPFRISPFCLRAAFRARAIGTVTTRHHARGSDETRRRSSGTMTRLGQEALCVLS